MSQTTVYLTGKRFQFIVYRLSDHSAFAKLRSHLPALTFLTQSLQYMLTLELCFKEQRGKEPGGCVAIPSTTGSAEGCFLDYVSLCFFWGYLSSEKAPQPCRHSCGCSSPSTPRTWWNTGNMETRKAANKCEPDPKPAKANGSYFSWYNSLPNTGTLGGKTSHNTWVFNSTLSKRCCITYSFSCDLKKKKLLFRSDSFSFTSSELFTGTGSSGSLYSFVFIIHNFTCNKHLKDLTDWWLRLISDVGSSLALSRLFKNEKIRYSAAFFLKEATAHHCTKKLFFPL